MKHHRMRRVTRAQTFPPLSADEQHALLDFATKNGRLWKARLAELGVADRAELIGGDASFEQLVATVIGFVEQPSRGLALPLDVRGTVFQERVWQALREIPAGTTCDYSEIAARIGSPRAVRAVAGACAANPLAVAIPCHRVVRRDGDLSGYRWGVERKRTLLDREARA